MALASQSRFLIGTAALAVIVAAGVFIYLHQSADHRLDERLHRTIGRVLAEETARYINEGPERTNKARLCVIAIDPKDSPEMKLQFDVFTKTVTNLCRARIKETEFVQSETSAKYGPGGGLSARRYARILSNNTNSDLFISLIGVPEWDKSEFARWTNGFPPLIAETRDRKRVKKLFEKGVLKTAIVPRFTYPAPASAPEGPDRIAFLRRHQIVTVADAAAMPTE